MILSTTTTGESAGSTRVYFRRTRSVLFVRLSTSIVIHLVSQKSYDPRELNIFNQFAQRSSKLAFKRASAMGLATNAPCGTALQLAVSKLIELKEQEVRFDQYHTVFEI
jgi:hypothetical protein